MKSKTLTSAVLAGIAVACLVLSSIASADATSSATLRLQSCTYCAKSGIELGDINAAHLSLPVAIPVYLDGTLSVGTDAATIHAPFAFTLSEVRVGVGTAPTGAAAQFDVNEAGSTVFSTELTIDDGEATSTTAATAAVISDTAIADGATITIDVVQVGSSVAGADAVFWLIGTR